MQCFSLLRKVGSLYLIMISCPFHNHAIDRDFAHVDLHELLQVFRLDGADLLGDGPAKEATGLSRALTTVPSFFSLTMRFGSKMKRLP